MSRALHFATYIAAAAFIVLLTIGQAPAQAVCMPWEQVLQTVERYGETPIGGGQVDAGTIIVVFASSDGKTFTVAARSSSGIGCLMAVGSSWEPGELPAEEREL